METKLFIKKSSTNFRPQIFVNTEKKVLNLLRLTDDFGLNLANLCISA